MGTPSPGTQVGIVTTVPFDTLKLTKALREKAHFTQEQAEGLTEALSESFEEQSATKQDVAELGSDLKHEIADMRKDMVLLEQRLTNKIDRMTMVLGTIVVAAISAATVVIEFVHT